MNLLGALEIFGPARIGRQGFALFQNQFPEFLDSQILNQELDPRAAAIFLFAKPGENARDGLRQRQQFFRRDKRVEEFRLVRHGAEAAAHIHFEATLSLLRLSVRVRGDQAHVVHARPGRRHAARSR